MDRRNFESCIGKAWAAAQQLGIGETFSNGGSLTVDIGFRDLILAPGTVYEEIFMYGLRNSNYNFLLSDHSFFQFSWAGVDDVRYAYYPNPFLGPDASKLLSYKKKVELLDADFISAEEFLQLLADAQGQGRVPVLRYENAPAQYKEFLHPCSHFHIGLHGDDRWAVRRLLSPYAFSLIVLRNYYGELWRASAKSEVHENLTQLDLELHRARAGSRLLDNGYFTQHEEEGFFFA